MAAASTTSVRGELRETWELRNAATLTLIKAEERTRRVLEQASVEELVGLLESFSPARSPGVEWTRTFEPLAERIWTWCSPETVQAVHEAFAARGMPWMAITNAFGPAQGEEIKARLSRPAWSRLPGFTLA
jgi:hypothetical protein